MRSPRPFLIRLIAIAFVIAGASGIVARAPHALRAWADTAAEVANARVSVQVRKPRSQPARLPDTQAIARRQIASAGNAPAPRSLGSVAWPTARAGRDVLALKSARLI